MKSTLLILLLRLLALLPLRLARALGSLLGQLCYLLGSRMARTTHINLELCFPDMEAGARERLARESLVQTFQTMAEAGAIWLWPAERTLGLIREVQGLELLQQAHASGRGVIIMTPHLGCWELMGLYLNTAGCGQTSQLYQAPADPRLDRVIFTARSRSGARMVATDKKGVAELLQTLRRGEVAGILPDQVPPESGGQFAPFFGRPALTMTLWRRLQEKTGAVVLLCAAWRVAGPEPGFRIEIVAPRNEIYAEHMPTAMAALNGSLEDLILHDPRQYQWSYKRFKRQPEGLPRPY